MKWWVNGLASDQVSAADRGLAYGDGLFETMRVVNYQIPLLQAHLGRLAFGADRLGLGFSKPNIEQEIATVLDWLSEKQWPQAVVKLLLTRSGPSSGYRCDCSEPPNIMLRATELQCSENTGLFQVKVCDYVLSKNTVLAGVKHLNRLDQVMASRELTADDDEGLLLSEEGLLVEGLSNNIFLVQGSRISTPRMPHSGVRGVMRDFLLENIPEISGLSIVERDIQPAELKQADEVFLSNAVRGVRNVSEIRGVWAFSEVPVGDQIRQLLCSKLGSGFNSF